MRAEDILTLCYADPNPIQTKAMLGVKDQSRQSIVDDDYIAIIS